ncbi:SDR family NAD(P)-dependent oxidoreductase [Micromonospora sp. U21]|uniref:SDR family NAD(P)-dependent oxidoreductase n=1 Tax=Micromonospora sp. U21 TaxID=2824899 RepID=UPI001B5D2D0E|nr:glucose 1-dehydrogenase [Micromonospora sp. U21]MBQ0901572.1 glucose 1-dehydrogenase [Micromonospora sp. U21]
MGTLTGQVAVVTGAAQGIGAAIATNLAAAGAAVVVNYYPGDTDRAAHVVTNIEEQGGRAIAIAADVTKAPDVESMFQQVVAEFGSVDILVNNAGVYEFGALERVTERDYRFQFDVNVLGVILATREAVQRFGPNGGSVVNISSTAVHMSQPNLMIYTATKSAVEAITRVLAKELGPRQIRVNAVAPGGTETEGGHEHGLIDSPYIRELVAQTPLARLGQPSDIAGVVTFLAGPEARWLTGEVILTSGGLRP